MYNTTHVVFSSSNWYWLVSSLSVSLLIQAKHVFVERGSERRKSERQRVITSKVFFKDDQNVKRSEHRKSERQKERRNSNLSDFQILIKCPLPMV